MRFAERISAPLLDALLIAASIGLLPWLRTLFAEPPLLLALPVALGYLGMCAGVWLLKLIERPAAEAVPAKDSDTQNCWLALLTFAFAVFALGMLLYTVSIGTDRPGGGPLENMPEKHPMMLAVVCMGMLAWIALFPLAALSRPRPRYRPGSAAALALRICGVLAVNCMILLNGAWIQAVFDLGQPSDLGVAGRLLLFALYYAVFLMFYAPPRLALIAIDGGDRLSLISLLIALGFFVWPLTA